VFYLRKHLRHFDEYINSLHEGTNNALHHSAAPIGPTMNIENTMCVMNSNAERSAVKKGIYNLVQFRAIKLYSEMKCAQSLNKFGYECLLSLRSRKDKYVSLRVGEDKFLVVHGDLEQKLDRGKPPQNIENDKSFFRSITGDKPPKTVKIFVQDSEGFELFLYVIIIWFVHVITGNDMV